MKVIRPSFFSEKLTEMVKAKVFLKYEGANPTGSFKDRGMTVAVSKAISKGAKAVICASTGNTSASAAAYAARAGIPCYVLLPEGAVALGKLSQAMIADAKVIAIKGNFDDALNLVREVSKKTEIAVVNSINPDRIEGQKTGAFEICDQLGGRCPDYHFIPVGNAGNITAYWKGYKEYFEHKKINHLPRMMGYQAEGAAPIVLGQVVQEPKTFATAIRIGNPASWKNAEIARDESKGVIDSVSEDEIRDAYSWLASKEGLFVEPASAAGVAGLIKQNKSNMLKTNTDSIIVCVLTGSGLKDPEAAIQNVSQPQAIPATIDDVIKQIKV